MSDQNQLVEIPHEELSILRDMYLKDWPNNLNGYYTIDNFIRWLEKESNIKNLKFYSLNGDYSDGTFLIVVSTYICILFKDYLKLKIKSKFPFF